MFEQSALNRTWKYLTSGLRLFSGLCKCDRPTVLRRRAEGSTRWIWRILMCFFKAVKTLQT